MALPGRNAAVKIGANSVEKVQEATFALDGELIDVTNFDSDGWREKIQGIRGATVNVSGFYDPTDTTGQVAIRGAWLAGTKLTDVTVLADAATATSGFTADMFVASFEISPATENAVGFSAALESDGAIAVSS